MRIYPLACGFRVLLRWREFGRVLIRVGRCRERVKIFFFYNGKERV
jgi:hypothetical protein